MLVGYAWTSSLAQVAGLEAQERELRAAGCERISSEQVSPVAQREQSAEIIRLKQEGVRPSEIASRLGIGRASVYRVLGTPTANGQVAA